MANSDKKVGFIGLGKMGSGICRNIQKAGFSLSVYNRTKSKMKPFVEAGAYEGQSPKEVASRSDIVLTSLMDDQSVLDTVSSENGILAGLKPGGIHIGLTTISVKTSLRLEKLHKEKGCIYLAGPVLGRPDAAESGEIRTFMSGDSDAIESCEALVKSYTSAIFKVGNTASEAPSMKVCANYIAITQIEMMGEIYAFAEKSGLNLDLIQMIFQGAFTEPTLKMYAAKIRNREFDGAGFELLGGLKDVIIFEEAFTDMRVIPGIAKVVKDKLVTAVARGLGNKDWSATYEITRLMAGLDG
jgi:3-hydroxyisobutyrate dehydrogenase-like beta-hydroxyacid dehydrogenase